MMDLCPYVDWIRQHKKDVVAYVHIQYFFNKVDDFLLFLLTLKGKLQGLLSKSVTWTGYRFGYTSAVSKIYRANLTTTRHLKKFEKKNII